MATPRGVTEGRQSSSAFCVCELALLSHPEKDGRLVELPAERGNGCDEQPGLALVEVNQLTFVGAEQGVRRLVVHLATDAEHRYVWSRVAVVIDFAVRHSDAGVAERRN